MIYLNIYINSTIFLFLEFFIYLFLFFFSKKSKEGRAIDFASDLCVRSVNLDQQKTTPLLDMAQVDINESDEE